MAAIRYFALTGRNHDVLHPYNIFREFQNRRGYFIQHLDAANPNKWIDDPQLVEYTIRGEPGAIEIDEAAARRFVESRGGHFSPPDLES